MQPAPFNSLAGDPPANLRSFWLKAEDGVRLRAAHWSSAGSTQPSRGTVLLLPGRTEYLEKYRDVADDLVRAGYDVISIDWRGQGLSDRLTDDPRASHIGDFADYQRDLLEMVVCAESLDLPRPWHLLSHSMGGAIGLAALIDGLPVERAVFSAPMWAINFTRGLRPIARALSGFGRRIGRGQGYVPGSGGTNSFILSTSFQRNLLTSDGMQWGRLVSENFAWPEMVLGGVTHDWLHAALAECDRLAALPAPPVPVLVALCGRDTIVSAGAIRDRVARWGTADLLELDGSKHEPMMERDAIRRQFMQATLQHLRGSP